MTISKYFSLNFGFFLITSVIASDLRLILPPILKIREGEDLQLHLTTILPETISCYVKTPVLTSYNLMSMDSENRISYWTENGECGVIAKNVTKNDAGRWRLTAKNSTNTLVDASYVEILDKVVVPERTFFIVTGLGYTLMLEEESRYCSIRQPHTEEILLISGECKVELNQPTAAVQGSWMATAGVAGQLKEIPVKAQLNVYRDKLATGFTRNIENNTIRIYCNLKNSDETLEFCRFSKPNSVQTGFQMSEGLRSGRYGYHGAGLDKGECGITIDAPTEDDYGRWLCTISVKNEEPFGSYVWVKSNDSRAVALTAEILSSNSTTTITDGVLRLRCDVSTPISYCWFLAPDGEIFTPRQAALESDTSYKYIGDGFGKGHCGMEITTAQAKHEGQWMCHMGPQLPGFELTSKINVRISETPLAAKVQHITIAEGESLTLECRTVPNKISIDYCRFFLPDGTGIHIGEEITEASPLILDDTRYWFSGISLQFGGCGLKVDRISSKHFGNWTCAARLEFSENYAEAFDIVVVDRGEPTRPSAGDNLTAAATTGIISGVLVLAALLVLGSIYMVKRIKMQRIQDDVSRVDTISVSADSMTSSSANSGISLQELTSNPPRA